jgi:hypothetical protein
VYSADISSFSRVVYQKKKSQCDLKGEWVNA